MLFLETGSLFVPSNTLFEEVLEALFDFLFELLSERRSWREEFFEQCLCLGLDSLIQRPQERLLESTFKDFFDIDSHVRLLSIHPDCRSRGEFVERPHAA